MGKLKRLLKVVKIQRLLIILKQLIPSCLNIHYKYKILEYFIMIRWQFVIRKHVSRKVFIEF